MSRASTGTSNANMQSAALQTNGEIPGNYANENFNQRDRNSRSDGYQTADQRKTHPNRCDEPDIFEHKKLLPAWKESLARAVFSRTCGKGQTPLP
jgi:hypothetical protein